MLSEEGNPFERETALLESNNNREEVLLLYEAAEFMSEANWKQCINKIRAYRTLVPSKSPEQVSPTLELELKMMEAFCLYHTGNQDQAEDILMDILADLDPSEKESNINNYNRDENLMTIHRNHHSLAVRAHTLAATIIVSSNDTGLDYKEIKNRLVSLLKPDHMHVYIPEVLGTLTGCKHLKALMALQDLPGMPSTQLARKMQIVADWKFIVGSNDEAIEFKRRAQNMWELLNCKTQFEVCQQELKDLSNKTKSEYLLKLAKIKVFADALLKIDQSPPANNKQTLVKWSISHSIDSILPPSEPEPKKKPSIGSSKAPKEDQKKELLKDVIGMCVRFYEVYKKEVGSETTNTIQNSKYLQEMIITVRKRLAILVKLKAVRLRQSWRRLRLIAFPPGASLSTSTLKGKSINN